MKTSELAFSGMTQKIISQTSQSISQLLDAHFWYLLMSGVWSLGGSPDMMVMRKTVMFNMVEMPRVIFSPDSAGIRNTNLTEKDRQSVSENAALYIFGVTRP